MATTKKRTTTAKPASRANSRSVSNGARPYAGLSDAARKAQQKRLRKLADELETEGFKPDPKHVEELRRRAATWPE